MKCLYLYICLPIYVCVPLNYLNLFVFYFFSFSNLIHICRECAIFFQVKYLRIDDAVNAIRTIHIK